MPVAELEGSETPRVAGVLIGPQATHLRDEARRETGQQEPPWYKTVCPVVWGDGGGDPAS